MAFFNINSNRNQAKLELADKLVYDASETHKDVEGVLSFCLKNQQQYDNLSDQIIKLSKKIKHKLDADEITEIEAVTEKVCDLSEDFFTCFRMISNISDKQAFRYENANKIHKKISQN